MRDVGPLAFDVLVHAIAAFGIGGLLGGLRDDVLARGATAAPRRSSRTPRLRAVPDARTPARLVVLVSGAGTNLQALLDACADPAYGARVVAVGADRDGIEGLARAERPACRRSCTRSDFTTAEAWDRALTDTVAELRARPGGAGRAS